MWGQGLASMRPAVYSAVAPSAASHPAPPFPAFTTISQVTSPSPEPVASSKSVILIADSLSQAPELGLPLCYPSPTQFARFPGGSRLQATGFEELPWVWV